MNDQKNIFVLKGTTAKGSRCRCRQACLSLPWYYYGLAKAQAAVLEYVKWVKKVES